MKGETTIKFDTVVLSVSYEYEKGDNGYWRDSNGDGLPATPSSVCVESVNIEEGNLLDVIANNITLSSIENKVLQQIEE